MPQVSLVTQPAIAIVSWLLLFMGRPAFPRQPKRLASLKLMLLQLLMQDSPPLLGSSHSNRDGVPRGSSPTVPSIGRRLPCPQLVFPAKGRGSSVCLGRKRHWRFLVFLLLALGFWRKMGRDGYTIAPAHPRSHTTLRVCRLPSIQFWGRERDIEFLYQRLRPGGRRTNRQTKPGARTRYGSSQQDCANRHCRDHCSNT